MLSSNSYVELGLMIGANSQGYYKLKRARKAETAIKSKKKNLPATKALHSHGGFPDISVLCGGCMTTKYLEVIES